MEVYTHSPRAPSSMLTERYRTRAKTLTLNYCAQEQSHNGILKHHSTQHQLSRHAQRLLSDRTRSSHRHIRTHYTSTVRHRRIMTALQRSRTQRHLRHTNSRSPSKSTHPPPTYHARGALHTPTTQMMRMARTYRSHSLYYTLVTRHLLTRQ